MDRRASSVYSVETTISNILDLYGGHGYEEEAPIRNAHRSQAYRDTVAPLMARRYSDSDSPPSIPFLIKRASGAESPPPLLGFPDEWNVPPAMPSPSLYQDFSPSVSPDITAIPPLPSVSPSVYHEVSPPLSPADSKDAPSFVDFTRSLPAKPFDTISPLSADGSEGYHRQLAMDALSPPSPRESPNLHPVALEGSNSYLPGPMSGTITHVVDDGIVPPPLDLNRTSVSSEEMTFRTYPESKESSFENFLVQGARKNSSIGSSLNKFHPAPLEMVSNSDDSNEILSSQIFTEQEKERVVSYASEKYPGMKSATHAPDGRTSARSSISRRASSLIHAMLVRKGSITLPGRHSMDGKAKVNSNEYVPPPRKNLAIQPTSYQLYGEASWEKYDKKKKNQKKDKRTSKDSNNTDDGEKLGFFGGARHKLTRSASEKRREKLKNSIKLVGTTEITKGVHAREDPRKWWE